MLHLVVIVELNNKREKYANRFDRNIYFSVQKVGKAKQKLSKKTSIVWEPL